MTNIRTQRTRAAIREALLSCGKEKPIGDLSIAEVCRRAGIDRTTFYRHYKDIDSVINDLLQEQLDQLRTLMLGKDKTVEGFINTFLASVESAKDLYRTNDGVIVSESFKSDIMSTVKEYGMATWKEDHPTIEELESELLFEAFLAGALQVALNEDGKADRATIIRTLTGLIYANYDRRLGA